MKKLGNPAKQKKLSVNVDNPAHYTGILLEQIRDQVTTVAEGVESVRHELGERIDRLETKLAQEGTDLRIAITMVDQKLSKKIDEKVDALDQKLSKKIDETKQELSSQIAEIGSRLDAHDREITTLKLVHNH